MGIGTTTKNLPKTRFFEYIQIPFGLCTIFLWTMTMADIVIDLGGPRCVQRLGNQSPCICLSLNCGSVIFFN